ncbi:MAG: GlxA family transcriptional regulator [Acidimicrobiales bacterium]|nr:GlxA family transcriptional regulator [Acidimicrobiales bacterium]
MTGAIEPFRVANHLLNDRWFEWEVVSADSQAVVASNGVKVEVDGDLAAANGADLTIVCASWFPERHGSPEVLRWLRKRAADGMRLGGVDTGSFVLAAAGVLDRQEATCNYDVLDAFRYRFPKVIVSDALYVADARHVTCSGSTAPLDLAVTLVGQAQGEQLADRVASHMFHQRFGGSSRSQLGIVQDGMDVEDARLAAATVAVRDNLSHPLSVVELADRAGTSPRNLRRLFSQAFGETPSAYSMRIRLARARQLVLHTELRMLDVALATGFEGPEHFSRSYSASFGTAPLRDRKEHRPRLTPTAFPERIGTS